MHDVSDIARVEELDGSGLGRIGGHVVHPLNVLEESHALFIVKNWSGLQLSSLGVTVDAYSQIAGDFFGLADGVEVSEVRAVEHAIDVEPLFEACF